jgi:ssDNA-binding Zn-finger/Zn-ribbon topoisomerase 1
MNGDRPPRCPDCGVEMKEMQFQAGGHYARFVSEESKEGILGSLGGNKTYRAQAVVCPECGLSRLYADLDEDA